MSRAKEALSAFALMAFAIVVSLLLAEVSLRAFGLTRIQSPMYVADPNTIYRLKPHMKGKSWVPGEFRHTWTTNSQGFRGTEEYASPKPPGVKRVLAIGDSFTFGIGVDDEDSFPAQLEMQLTRSCSGSRIQVINAGVPGFSTSQELELLERYGLPLEPDLVLLGFFINDVEGNLIQAVHFLDGDSLVAKPDSIRPQLPAAQRWVHRMPGYEWLTTNSAVVNWLRQLYFGHRAKHPHPSVEATRTQDAAADTDTASMWVLTDRLLSRMRGVAEENGSSFRVLLIPDEPTLQRYIAGQPDSARVLSMMRRICREARLDCIDVADWIRRESTNHPLPLYFPVDGHFKPLGNRLTANAAYAHLAPVLGCRGEE